MLGINQLNGFGAGGAALSTVTPGTPAVFESAFAASETVAALSSTKALVCYYDNGNSNYGTTCVLDISALTVTPATPAVFESADTAGTSVATLSSTKAIVAYIDNGNSGFGTACVLDVSGSTITPATPAVFESASIDGCNIAALSSTKAIVVYSDAGNSNYGTACILSISGSTITAGTPAVFESATSYIQGVIALSSTKALVIYQDVGNSSHVTGCVLDVSGTTITPGAPSVVKAAACSNGALAMLSSTSAVMIYSDAGNSDYGTARILDVSGTTITPGLEAVFHLSATQTMRVAALSASKAVAAYRGTSNYGTACAIDIQGAIVTPGTPAVFESAVTTSPSITALSATAAIVAYGDSGNSNYGTACALAIA